MNWQHTKRRKKRNFVPTRQWLTNLANAGSWFWVITKSSYLYIEHYPLRQADFFILKIGYLLRTIFSDVHTHGVNLQSNSLSKMWHYPYCLWAAVFLSCFLPEQAAGREVWPTFKKIEPPTTIIYTLCRNDNFLWLAWPNLHMEYNGADKGIRQPMSFVSGFVFLEHWWLSWWVWAGFLAIVSIVVWFHLLYLRYIRVMKQDTKLMHEVDTFKNRFFTNITHEFRTPITIILGMSEQLETNADPEQKKHIKLIKRSGQDLLRLVNQILDLSKLESGALQLNYVQGDVSAYLRYIAASVHSLAESREVQLELDCAQHVIVMDYDPDRLLQIVYNLLSNAIKFTPPGGKVTMCSGMKSGVSEQLLIRVADTGSGIAPDALPHLFDRFFQAQNLEKARTGGTGIGLALTHELVGAMGGTISVESTPGQGTTFEVLLPVSNNSVLQPGLQQVPDTDVEPFAEKNMFSTTAFQPFETKLLIIEDNPDMSAYLTAFLGAHFALDYAGNGRIGVEKALKTIPDLILSDVMMPEMDGYEVCNILKNDPHTSHIPIVLLTAKTSDESRVAGLQHGANAYLTKPFNQQELLLTLNNLLELRRQLQQRLNEQVTGMHRHNTPIEVVFIQQLHNIVLEHCSDPAFGVPELCRSAAMSRPQLHRKLTALTDKNPSHFIRSVRLGHARKLLLSRKISVQEAATETGFDDPKYFSRAFAEEFGLPPSRI